MSNMWGLKAPSGLIIQEIVGKTWREAWCKTFDMLARQDPAWGEKYWKRWKPAIRSARRRGYRIIKVKIVRA